jgi:hypothetical protein
MRPTIVISLILVTVAAGCAGPSITGQDPEPPSDPTAQPGNQTDAPGVPQVEFTLLGEATTQAETVVYRVTTDRPLPVTLVFNGTVLDSLVVAGTHEWTLQLPYGRRALNVTVEADGFTATDGRSLVRLAPTALTIDYCTFHPDHAGQRTVNEYEYWIDVDSRPSTPLYDEVGAEHADAFTAHDQLYVFEQETSTPVDVEYSESLSGFFVEYIDGAGNPASSDAPPYWLYEVNGESASMGMSLQALRPGDAVRWILSTLGPPCE